jgi:hypothetical protein
MGSIGLLASSPTDAFERLVTWIEGTGADDLGWTLVDTLTATDKVYSIAGQTIARPTIYIRMTLNVFDEAPGSNPIGNQDNIVFRIYRSWSTGTHTGKGEAGRIGPRILVGPCADTRRYLQKLALFLPASEQYSVQPNLFSDFVAPTASSWAFNGRGVYFICREMTGILFYDFATNETTAICQPPYTSDLGANNLLILTNKPDGSEHLWVMVKDRWNPLYSVFYSYDVQNNSWSAALADPPWGDFQFDYRPWAWDGADTIYMAKGETPSGTDGSPFAKYTISTGLWTSLAIVPFVSSWGPDSNSVNYSQMVYVPATLSGHAHDEIYASFLEGIGFATWSRYDVVTDTWTTSPTGIANLPVANTLARLWLDPTIGNHGTIFGIFFDGDWAPSLVHSYDIENNFWSPAISTWNATNDTWQELEFDLPLGVTPFTWLRTYAGALYLSRTASEMTIKAVGNKDFISIVAHWLPDAGPSIQRWAYAGFYQSYMKTDKFTASSGFGNGKNVTVTLTETVTDLLIVGDFVEIYDPTASVVPQAKGQPYVAGGGEVCRIVNIPNEHQIVLDTVCHSYSAGVLLGQDIASAVVGNDCQMFCALRGENGFHFSGEADLYHATPLISRDKANSFGKRSVGILTGLQLSQNNPALNSYNTVGELFNVWTANFMSKPGESAPAYEFRNNEYFYIFSPFLKNRLRDSRNFEIGPVIPET